jgi:hypothetical protein
MVNLNEIRSKRGKNMPNYTFKNLAGQRFGRLVVIELTDQRRSRRRVWKCICDCGNIVLKNSKLLLTGTTKSCGCLYKGMKNNIYQNGESNFKALYNNYKGGAHSRGHIFDLSVEEFRKLVGGNCYYCGIEPKQIISKVGNNGEFLYNGIDRINSSSGYILNNCVSSCKECNFAKRALTEEEFLSMIKRIYNYRKLGDQNG